MINKDFIITLAWPEGMVTASGSWYDNFFSKNGKYRVGHSALILVNSQTKKYVFVIYQDKHGTISENSIGGLNTNFLPKGAEVLNIDITNKKLIIKFDNRL